MRKRLKKLLQRAGLRHEEVLMYLLLLTLQKASMQQLITKSALGTMMAYRTIRRLQDRGLVEEISINNKQCVFTPLSLQNLIHTLDKHQRKLRRLELELRGVDHLLPYTSIDTHKDIEEPIEIRCGIEAMKEEYLKMPDLCSNEYFHIGSMEAFWKTVDMTYESAEERSFMNKRFSSNVHARIVDVPSETSDVFKKRDSLEKRTTRFSKTLPIPNNYLAIGTNHVCHFLCDKEDPRVIVIRQLDLVNLHKKQFWNLWKTSEV